MGAGTSSYNAPECYDDQFFKASDVYAYGIIGYELLTRKKPWEGKSALAVMNAVNQGERPGLLPDTPLGEMVKECWAQEHSERPNFVQLIISPALMPPAATSAAPPHPPSESHLAQEIVAAVRYELEAAMKLQGAYRHRKAMGAVALKRQQAEDRRRVYYATLIEARIRGRNARRLADKLWDEREKFLDECERLAL
jgi:serine/threonine protein kinase